MVAGEANRLPADGRTELSRTYRACLGSAGPRNATFRQGMVHLFPSPTDGNAKRNLLQSLRITNREFQRSSKKGLFLKALGKKPASGTADETSRNHRLFCLKKGQKWGLGTASSKCVLAASTTRRTALRRATGPRKARYIKAPCHIRRVPRPAPKPPIASLAAPILRNLGTPRVQYSP